MRSCVMWPLRCDVVVVGAAAQAMELREALEEAKEFTQTLSSPESFVLILAEMLTDGVEVRGNVS